MPGGQALPPGAGCRGAVLLEVVLALVLFVFAATIITGALSSSVHEVDRLRLNAHASNLAVSILSEMQMGLLAVEATGEDAFDPPFDQWTWQTTVDALADSVGGKAPPQRVEVIVRHKSEPIVCRLTQFMPAASGPATGKSPAASPPGAARSSAAAGAAF